MRISDWSSDVCSSDLEDEDTWETYQDYRRRGIFDKEFPEEKAEFWRDCAADNVLDHVDPFLEEALSAANVELDLCDTSALRLRSEERRVGKECVRTCRSRGDPCI